MLDGLRAELTYPNRIPGVRKPRIKNCSTRSDDWVAEFVRLQAPNSHAFGYCLAKWRFGIAPNRLTLLCSDRTGQIPGSKLNDSLGGVGR